MPGFVGRGIEIREKKSSNAERNRIDSNCSNSIRGGKMKRNNLSKINLELVRREWRLQQQQMEAHQRRKKIFIKEYEIEREQRLKKLNGGTGLFKEPKGMQISPTELHKIKVNIYRNIPDKSTANKLQRHIANLEDVVVKRRAGEGSKPIFEREELQGAVNNTEEVEEYRTVATVKDANLEKNPQTSKRRSASLSLTRNRSHSNQPTSSRHSRHEDYKRGDRENRRSNSNRSRSRERKNRRRTQSCHVGDEKKRVKKRNRRDRSRSKETDQAKWDRNSCHSKLIRGRSKEERMPSQQIPIPIYYGNFPPRPVMVGPLVPFRGHVAFGGSRYPMWPMRPFGLKYPPRIDMYRLRPPGNPRRFGPQY